jgi:hypothetical protein
MKTLKMLIIVIIFVSFIISCGNCGNRCDIYAKYKFGDIVYIKPDSLKGTLLNKYDTGTGIPEYEIRLGDGTKIQIYGPELY